MHRATYAGIAALVLLTGCSAASAPETETTPGVTTPAAAASSAAEQAGAQQAVEFEYDGDRGPDTWPALSPDWGACADATTQSPIDLHDAVAAELPALDFAYTPGVVALKNTTHTVQADETPGSELVVGDTHYNLTQFHLHENAEHTLDGVRHDAELHLVHTAADGRIAVVAVLIDQGAADTALGTYFDGLPAVGEKAELPAFDPEELLPANRSNVRYTGSLTTPPCTQGVSWFVMTTPVQASADQLDRFRSVISENVRPLQEQGAREVLLDNAVS